MLIVDGNEGVEIMQKYFETHDYPFVATWGSGGFGEGLIMQFNHIKEGRPRKQYKVPSPGPAKILQRNDMDRGCFFWKNITNTLLKADKVA